MLIKQARDGDMLSTWLKLLQLKVSGGSAELSIIRKTSYFVPPSFPPVLGTFREVAEIKPGSGNQVPEQVAGKKLVETDYGTGASGSRIGRLCEPRYRLAGTPPELSTNLSSLSLFWRSRRTLQLPSCRRTKETRLRCHDVIRCWYQPGFNIPFVF